MLVKDQHVQGTVMNIEVHSQYHWLTSYSKCKLWTTDYKNKWKKWTTYSDCQERVKRTHGFESKNKSYKIES